MVLDGDGSMDPMKVGKFIKELRKKNNLTQAELADKYGVTYQAVSKWERGINLPEVSLIKEMSKDFNISIESLLDGEVSQNNIKNNYKKYIVIIVTVLVIIGSVILIISRYNKNDTFDFKTLSTTCQEFKVSGSIAYDKIKSSIYISHIDYCGGNDDTIYKSITCSLYESSDDSSTKISSCQEKENITLEDYLKDMTLKIDHYSQNCKNYHDNSLYLEINATSDNEKIITYRIPLSLNNNCPTE